MRLTAEELAAMPAKAKRDQDVIDLYLEHDFIDAYALHTAKRIEKDGYKAAIGGGDSWEPHGDLQLAFLKSVGLLSHHSLLEIGCGTGRLARKVVPCLHVGKYVGVDISPAAIDCAQALSLSEGWKVKRPAFYNEIPTRRFDFVWAFSVFIHLPQDIMTSVMRRAVAVMDERSRFFWSYVPEEKAWRSACKQFRHTQADYERASSDAGLTFEDVPNWIRRAGYEQNRWTGSQRVAVSRLA